MPDIVSFKKNEVIFKEGDPADRMFVVKSGTIRLSVGPTLDKADDPSAAPLDVALLGTGQLFGEMALFDKRARSATATAESDVELVSLPYKKLEQELNTMPEWVQAALKSLSEKIRLSNQQLLRSQKKD